MFDNLNTVVEVLQDFNIWSISFRIIMAALVGGAIGVERGRHGRAAGMRTHMLVCLGATMTTLVGLYTAFRLGFGNDPLRVGAQVISGIGFLGVGTILTRNNSHVTGLTTAAGLWATASIGLSIGVGFYSAVVVAFIVVMFTMTFLTRLESERKNRDTDTYYLEIDDVRYVNDFHENLYAAIPEAELQIVPARSNLPGNVGLEITLLNSRSRREIMDQLGQREYVLLMVPVAK